ncbi:D-alanyl-D-alanine carboxypeptidase family protein (plasmid) [Alkalihalophilus sp. As8PL]|uniref:D-alanyl-D-alanine carboxypeptidase family protein n=1 Tax=Alkalihalophilus sp. As8PL TaxID=3237103 RepID=A0AB39BNB3_9BACI
MKKKGKLPFLFAFLLIFSPYTTVLSHSEDELILFSEAAILIDAGSGQILYEKNSKMRMNPASITKIVTGIMAIEQGNLDDIVTVSQEATEVHGTSVYLLENEKIKLKQLVQGLLINSGNDAGTAIAEYFSNNETDFANWMNDYVKTEIGVNDSNFTNPHGLFDENHYTTAYDMAQISQYAMNNNLFKVIVGTKELEWNGEGWQTTLYNHHRMLWDYEGVTGIKNGYTPQSGFTLVTSATRNNIDLIAVTLKSPSSQQAYQDTGALLDYGFDTYSVETLSNNTLFEDEAGTEYKLNDNLSYLVPKNTEVTKKIRNGLLVIKKQDGSILLKEELSKVVKPDEQKEVTQSSEVELSKPNNNWIQQILQIFNIF